MDPKSQLIACSARFIAEIKNETAGAPLERWLNEVKGPDSAMYQELAGLVRAGVQEGWLANVEITGRHYRRSRLLEPSAEMEYFSITAVYMESGAAGGGPGSVFRGDYHAHPYGEVNMVVPLTPGAELAGPLGWRGAGWTAPTPGSEHCPEVRGGAVIAFFFLPAGRISYGKTTRAGFNPRGIK